MILVIVLLVGVIVAQGVLLNRHLSSERDRSLELQKILEARAAPVEYTAYVAAPAYEPPDPTTWVSDDTGLIGDYEAVI